MDETSAQPQETLGRIKIDVAKELEDVFTPLCRLTADYVAHHPELAAQLVPGALYELPEFNRSEPDLPWDVFKYCDVEGDLWPKITADPLEDWEAYEEQAVPPWLKRYRTDYVTKYKAENPQADDEEIDKAFDRLDGKIWRLRQNREDLDFASWKSYEQYLASLPDTEREKLLRAKSNRDYNAGKWYGATPEMRQVPRTLCLITTPGTDTPFATNLVVPVGEYGEAFAQSLLQTTARLQMAADIAAPNEADVLTASHAEALSIYTARAEGTPTTDTTMATLHEGILSITQTIAILTTQKVEGYDDPNELARAIVNSGLTERLARYSPMGFVGPMAISGTYWPDCLVKDGDKLKLSDEFEGHLKAARSKYIAKYAMQQPHAKISEDNPVIYRYGGRPCPVAGKNGGIVKLGAAFVDLLDVER